MSCEGPLLQVHPQHPSSPHYSAMASLDPRNSHIFRPRSNSSSGHMLQVPGDNALVESHSSPSSPTHSGGSNDPSNSLVLPLGSSNFTRSASLPRGMRGKSAEPQDPLSSSVTERSMRAVLSPRFIRRTATIDTYNMHKEEFEVPLSLYT